MQPYPLTFEPILKEKVWGGRRLSRYGKRLLQGRKYGESWEVADLPATSASGGGGGSARSVIDNGAMAGRTIGDAIGEWGADLLGTRGMQRALEVGEQIGASGPVFPLLLKYLDACEHLSVQCHPSPAYVARHPGAHLKTESWFVVEADGTTMPDGSHCEPSVFVGVREDVTAEAFRGAIERGTVAEQLVRLEAVAGDCLTLPSGTCHALGAGVLVAEVQTPSDTTYRVYDWTSEYRREKRDLHVQQALECMSFGCAGCRAPDPQRRAAETAVGRVATTPYYFIDEAAPDAPAVIGANLTLVDGAESEGEGMTALAIMVLAGEGKLRAEDGSFADVRLSPGQTVLVPAACVAHARAEGRGLLGLRVGIR